MKTNNIIHWTIKIGWEDGTEEYIADIPDWVANPVDEFLGEIEKEKREEEPVLPDGLQKYMDGVALNILYSEYHKSTNGMWSRAEVFEDWEEDGDVPAVYEAYIDYGCQDDTGGRSYRVTMYFFKKDGEWTCDDVSPIDKEKV